MNFIIEKWGRRYEKSFIFNYFITVLCLSSCGNSAYNSAANHIKTHLKSPSTYNLISASGYENDEFKAFLITFEAENSFGMSVKTTVFTANDKDNGDFYCSICEPVSNYCSLRYYVAKDQGKEIYSK